MKRIGWLLCFLVFAGFGHASMQEAGPDGGRGVIRMSSTAGSAALPSSLTMPVLLGRGPQDEPVFAAPGNNALIVSSERDGDTVRFQVRDDLVWSDGAPVTAYDAALAVISTFAHTPYRTWVEAVTVEGETAFTITFAPLTCASLIYLVDLPALPAHAMLSQAPDVVFTAISEDGAATANEWAEALARYLPNGEAAPTYVNGGLFQLVESSGARQRYAGQGEAAGLALEASTPPDGLTAVDMFLAGETNLLLLDDYGFAAQIGPERVSDLRAAAARHEIVLAELPGDFSVVLLFNQADPLNPLNGTHESQGVNPITADPAVREALALVMDRPRIISEAYQGLAVPIGVPVSPSSWAYVERPAERARFDEAAALLTAAGWSDTNGDGVRECVTCTTVPAGTLLMLRFANGNTPADNLITWMAGEAGIWLQGGYVMTQQTFDVATVTFMEQPGEPALGVAFAPEGDRLLPYAHGMNPGSISDPDIAALLDETAFINDGGWCPPETRLERAPRIAEAFDRLVGEHWVIPLVTPLDFAAARGIEGFAPRPFDTFNGIAGWRVLHTEAAP